jgi:hypothetical protein
MKKEPKCDYDNRNIYFTGGKLIVVTAVTMAEVEIG